MHFHGETTKKLTNKSQPVSERMIEQQQISALKKKAVQNLLSK